MNTVTLTMNMFLSNRVNPKNIDHVFHPVEPCVGLIRRILITYSTRVNLVSG